MTTDRSTVLVLLLLSAVIVMMMIGCSERESTFIDDREEIRRNIATSDAGVELFRTEGFIPDEPYYVGSLVYRDSLLSFERIVTIDLHAADNLTTEFETADGTGRIAEAIVQDEWDVQVTILGPEPGDTDVVIHDRRLTRYGLFAKVGDDTRAYAGWRLWGYNGGYPLSPADINITSESGTTFQGDPTTYERQVYYKLYTDVSPPDYVTNDAGDPRPFQTTYAYTPLTQIPTIDNGDSLEIIGDFLTGLDRYQLVVFESDTGFVTQALDKQVLEDRFYGVVDTRDNNPRRYNVLYLQQIRYSQVRPENITHQGWCAPFHVEQ